VIAPQRRSRNPAAALRSNDPHGLSTDDVPGLAIIHGGRCAYLRDVNRANPAERLADPTSTSSADFIEGDQS
jgi:hypothetical protein